MFNRILKNTIESRLHHQKVSLLLGARRVGKTILLREIYEQRKEKTLWLNGEDANVINLLAERTQANYQRLLKGYSLLIIDEAQYIPDIARKAKLIIDTISPFHIILTGSSAFDLIQMGEPLVGRTLTYQLFGLSQTEWQQSENPLQTKENLEERLIFGSYPEISAYNSLEDKIRYLTELVSTYLLRDVLVFEQIKNAQILKDLLVLLAYQVGSEVSTNELGRQLNMSKNTVDRYLDLLQKAYIIFSLGGYSKNLRKEVSKSKKWYFLDNGVRNTLIGNFQPLALRQDVGILWEQYLLNERIKKNQYEEALVKSYFWRTYDQQEIDLIESNQNELSAFEFKWKPQNAKEPIAFSKSYPKSNFQTIHPENYLNWINIIEK